MNVVRTNPGGQPRASDAGIVVIGSGAAGLTVALALAPRPVTVLTKTATLVGGSTGLAQGGIAVALDAADSPQLHAADTIVAGDGLCDAPSVELLTGEGPARIRELIEHGMRFDCDAAGRLAFGREAAHRHRRILHAGGDATGGRLQRTLAERVRAAPSVTIAPHSFAWDLVVDGDRVRGVLAHDPVHGWRFLRADHVVLATGGSGQLYRATTNPAESTADGLAMAARAGVPLVDLEFVQFHPTAFADPRQAPGAPLPLLTEALRGEGARLVDAAGAPLPIDHPDGDLAPRDVVARAVWREVAAGRPVRLDARPVFAHAGARAHFPTVAAICRAAGLDPATAPLPVMPAAHYHMGGVATDEFGRTALAGLWACGEAAATGVHGANRLASNSLLEALVFGHRVAVAIGAESVPAQPAPDAQAPSPPTAATLAAMPDILRTLRATMYERVGLERDRAGLVGAVAMLSERLAGLDARAGARPAAGPSHRDIRRWGELRNLLLVGRLVAQAALDREESRGAHRRRDFPAARPGAARHSRIAVHGRSGFPALEPV